MVYIILLNYNGWKDTIECLESIFKLYYYSFRVIVVDNNSPNNSLEYLKRWAAGDLMVEFKNKALQHLTDPALPKPVHFKLYTKEEAEKEVPACNATTDLIFIQAGENRGFAAGNNIGIQFALKDPACEFVWLLNNDTVVEKDVLSKMEVHYKAYSGKLGILGSKLLYYHNPTEIQAIAGKYNKWLGTTSHLGGNSTDNGQFDSTYPLVADYIVGASMFVSKAFINEVGLMQEDYFLYFEELDWSFRGKRKGWKIDVCTESRVYHKEGASINANESKSELADFYSLRNRILFTRRFTPIALPSVYLSMIGVAFNRLRRGQPERLSLIFKVLLGRRS